jgi:hypothetical protein
MHGMQQSIARAVAGILHEFGDPSVVVEPTLGGAAGRLGFLVLTIERGCGDRYRCHRIEQMPLRALPSFRAGSL